MPALLCVGSLACSRQADGGSGREQHQAHAVEQASTQASAAPGAAPSAALPHFDYVPAVTWQSTRPGIPEVAPPDPARETWRALVSQNRPLQAKTPLWQPLAAVRSVELAMPEASAYRCVLTPLSTTPVADDFGVRLAGWDLARRLLCSSDGFRSWTEDGHVVRVLPDGTREVATEGGALLRERDPDGSLRETYVLVRSDAEQRTATIGPPRILPGAARADD